MKKLYAFILFLALSSSVRAQNDSIQLVDIKYNYVVRGNDTRDISYDGFFNLLLFSDFGVSIYDLATNIDENNPLLKSDLSVVEWKPKGKNLSTLYKDYANNQVFLKDIINFKFFVQKDSLNIFNWKIKDATKNILGYQCQLATTTFRGRNYEAWFTAALPVCGPWKFDDLPGAILAVKAVDNYVSWEAKGIVISKKSPDIIKPTNPFVLNKALTWSEFKLLYKEKAIAISKYKTEDGEPSTSVTPRMGTERYIEEDDNDYQADKVMKKIMNKNK